MATFVGDAPIRPVDVGYVAGIIDGEGWMLAAPWPTVAVKMTDEDVIRRLQALTGVGNVTGPRIRAGRKPIWQWTVSRSRDVAALLMTVYPLLGQRRQAKAREVLEAWRALPVGTRAAAACGSRAGYMAHLARHEPTCAECRTAHASYMRERRAA